MGRWLKLTACALALLSLRAVDVYSPFAGVNGAAGPAETAQIGCLDGSGHLQPNSSSNGCAVYILSSVLPTGAASAANQTIELGSLASILSQLNGSVAVTGTFWPATQPVSASSLPLPSGAATSANQATQIDDLATIAANQAAQATAANQATELTDLTALNTVFGTVADAQWSGSGNGSVDAILKDMDVAIKALNNTNPQPVRGDVVDGGATSGYSVLTGGVYLSGGETTVNGDKYPFLVDANGNLLIDLANATLPLPTGASSSSLQTTGNTTLSSILTKLNGSVAVTGTFWQTTQPVSGTFWQTTQPVSGTFWQATQPISAASLPNPTGAATGANQSTANGYLSTIATWTASPAITSVDLGTAADAAWSGSGSGSLIAISKKIEALLATPPALAAGQNNIGNVGGKTVSVCVTPTITASNSYGTNYVVGGLLTFSNAFTSTGTGILESVIVTIRKVETSGFTFIPFNLNPSNTTWTDASVAAINSADIFAVREPVSFTSTNSQLGTMTVLSADGLGELLAPASTTEYGILLSNAALTNQFASGDVQVCIKVLDDI